MTAQGGVAAQVLQRASGLRQSAARRIADYVAVRDAVSAFVLLGTGDMLLPLSGRLRGLLLLWIAANVALNWRKTTQTPAPDFAAVARFVESDRPELDNALIHAVQFASLLAAAPDHPAAPLMRREMERGEREALNISHAEIVPAAPLRRERRHAQMVLAAVLFSMPIFPRAWRFEVPRLLACWRDYPPFTLTDFAVVPGDAQVKAGSGLTITARLDGPLPGSLELVSAQEGDSPQSAPMLKLDARTFSARMENLSAATWYYVRGETGRSSRYRLQIKPTANAQKTDAPESDAKKPENQNNAEPKRTEADVKKDLDALAEAQAKLARDAKQNAGRNPKPGDPQTEALRKRQQDLAQKADALAKRLKSSPQNAKAQSQLEKARRAMNRAATGSVSKNAQAAAEQLQNAAQTFSQTGSAGTGQSAQPGQSAETRPRNGARPTEERALPQSRDRSAAPGTLPAASGPPPTGRNGDVSRYPVEYRRLVQDYFQSVAEKK